MRERKKSVRRTGLEKKENELRNDRRVDTGR